MDRSQSPPGTRNIIRPGRLYDVRALASMAGMRVDCYAAILQKRGVPMDHLTRSLRMVSGDHLIASHLQETYREEEKAARPPNEAPRRLVSAVA